MILLIFILSIVTFLNVIIVRTRTAAEKVAIRAKISAIKARNAASRAAVAARQDIMNLDLPDKSPNALTYT
jgi:hypothetical protein